MAFRDASRFRALCGRGILYILLIAALMQGVLWEALHLGATQRFSERGFTELAQSALLLGATGLSGALALRVATLRQVSLLLFALCGASLIREQDYWLETYVLDGLWKVLVALLLVPVCYRLFRQRRALLAEIERFSHSAAFGLFAAGFLTTYVFSRLYGRGVMWQAILGDAYVRAFKNAAEEVTELFGYSLILIAVIELALLLRRSEHYP